MQAGALRPYEWALVTRAPLRLHTADGRATHLEIDRWLEPADDADRTVVGRCTGPVLDVGCGPGRIVAALAGEGLLALGIDIAATAVAITRRQGLNALRRNVFAHVPGEGRWATIVLLDGNIGIGGDPTRLLARVRELLAPSGQAVVETDPDPAVDEQVMVRFAHTGEPVGPPFPWAHVGRTALGRHAAAAGLAAGETWTTHARTFTTLRPLPRAD